MDSFLNEKVSNLPLARKWIRLQLITDMSTLDESWEGHFCVALCVRATIGIVCGGRGGRGGHPKENFWESKIGMQLTMSYIGTSCPWAGQLGWNRDCPYETRTVDMSVIIKVVFVVSFPCLFHYTMFKTPDETVKINHCIHKKQGAWSTKLQATFTLITSSKSGYFRRNQIKLAKIQYVCPNSVGSKNVSISADLAYTWSLREGGDAIFGPCFNTYITGTIAAALLLAQCVPDVLADAIA